jgi:hypothetical protein
VKLQRQPEPKLEPTEWNFDKVPDSELVACCYWEYARESAFIVDTLRRYREWWQARQEREGPDYEEIDRSYRLIQDANPYHTWVFLNGCTLDREYNWQTEDPKAPNYKHPAIPLITGRFPDPWQSLQKEEQQVRAHIFSEREVFRPVAVKLGRVSDATLIGNWSGAIAAEQDRQRKQWEADYLRGGKVAEGAPDPPECPPIRPGLFTAGPGKGESVVLEIGWQYYTNDEIANCFRRRLPKLRPPAAPAPDRRGHKPNDVRADLACLAAMRLLSVYKFNEIAGAPKLMLDTRPELPESRAVWTCEQFDRAKWRDAGKWYEARRNALKTFHRLFPFLREKDEKPRHWQTEGDRRKRGK